jgi:hypothetical protein
MPCLRQFLVHHFRGKMDRGDTAEKALSIRVLGRMAPALLAFLGPQPYKAFLHTMLQLFDRFYSG